MPRREICPDCGRIVYEGECGCTDLDGLYDDEDETELGSDGFEFEDDEPLDDEEDEL